MKIDCIFYSIVLLSIMREGRRQKWIILISLNDIKKFLLFIIILYYYFIIIIIINFFFIFYYYILSSSSHLIHHLMPITVQGSMPTKRL